jgi:membrane protease subunit HflK
MAWNEPGGSGGRDPWSGRNDEQGPPDLSDIVRKMQDKYGGLFGGGGGRPSGGGGMKRAGIAGILLIVLAAVVLWGLTGFYKVDEAEQGVVLRFGEYVRTADKGLHWHIPYPVEEVKKVNIRLSYKEEFGFRLLTQDENIVELRFEIQFEVNDPVARLFNVFDPVETLRQVTESAMREVVGKSTMDYVITEGRADIAQRTQALAQKVLDHYQAGLLITRALMQKATAPQQVQAAFADAVKAREDEERLKNEAEAYANDIIPKARGSAARILEQARGYKASVVAKAEGEADRFSKVLVEYEKAVRVTRERLYLETLEDVLGSTGKVLLDVKDSGNIMYLPLDRLMGNRGAYTGASAGRPAEYSTDVSQGGSARDTEPRSRRNVRSRGGR